MHDEARRGVKSQRGFSALGLCKGVHELFRTLNPLNTDTQKTVYASSNTSRITRPTRNSKCRPLCGLTGTSTLSPTARER